MTDEELMKCAIKFMIVEWKRDPNVHIRGLYVEFRGYTTDGKKTWAITTEGSNICLNKQGEWEWEPFPSTRTKDFFKNNRWSDLKKAVKFAEEHMQKNPTGYSPESYAR